MRGRCCCREGVGQGVEVRDELFGGASAAFWGVGVGVGVGVGGWGGLGYAGEEGGVFGVEFGALEGAFGYSVVGI